MLTTLNAIIVDHRLLLKVRIPQLRQLALESLP